MNNESLANCDSMFCMSAKDKYILSEGCVQCEESRVRQSLNTVRVEFAFLALSQADLSWVSDVLFMMFINEISRC